MAVTEDNRKAAAWAEILVVAVKPQFYGAVLEEIRDCRPSGQVVVTIAPGISTEWVEHRLGAGVKVVRHHAQHAGHGGGRHDGGLLQPECGAGGA